MKIADKFIDLDKLWKLASARFSALGAGVMFVLTVWPDSILALWQLLPPDVHAVMPQQLVAAIGGILFVATFVSRFVKQAKLHETTK